MLAVDNHPGPSDKMDSYNVTVNQSGFRKFLESGVRINANSAITIDIKLEAEGVTNTITAESNALQVETQSTQMGDVIEGSTITSVPLNGRSYIDLLALQPGVSPYSGDDTAAGLVQAPIFGSLNNGDSIHQRRSTRVQWVHSERGRC